MSANVLYIALGGAVGAVGRYAVDNIAGLLFGHGFPFGTLAVNILGSVLLGAFVELSALAWSPPPEIRVMIVVGMLGAFTTFSTMSLDVVTLVTRGEMVVAAGYVLLSLVLGFGGLWGGMSLVKLLVL